MGNVSKLHRKVIDMDPGARQSSASQFERRLVVHVNPRVLCHHVAIFVTNNVPHPTSLFRPQRSVLSFSFNSDRLALIIIFGHIPEVAFNIHGRSLWHITNVELSPLGRWCTIVSGRGVCALGYDTALVLRSFGLV